MNLVELACRWFGHLESSLVYSVVCISHLSSNFPNSHPQCQLCCVLLFMMSIVKALAITVGCLSVVVSALRKHSAVGSALPAGESQVTVSGRRVVIHNPGRSGSLPLVLGLHGWYGSATDRGSFCGAANIAEHSSSLGFIGVCPDGYRVENAGSWNAAGCCGNSVDDDVDDVQFLRDVVSYVKQHASISKVYAMGHSNGAMMTFRLACEASDIIDGVAPINGGWFGSPAFNVIRSHPLPNGWHRTNFECSSEANSSQSVSCSSCYDYASSPSDNRCWKSKTFSCTAPAANFPMLYIHGENDQEEPYELVVAGFHHYAQEVLGCGGLATSPNYIEGKAKCFEYASCSEGRRVTFCSVRGMGHSVPARRENFDGVRAAWSWFHGGWPSLAA